MSETKNYSEGELLDHAKELFSAGLSQFHVNHDMCTKSGFFTQNTVMEMDTCAMTFRDLVRATATKLAAASVEWTDLFISFCRSIYDIDHGDALKKLNELGDKAKQVGRVYDVIAAWARDTAGRLHTACVDTEREAESFVKKYKQILKEAHRLVDEANASLKRAQGSYNSAEANERHLSKLRLALCWNLIALAVLSSKVASAQRDVSSKRSALNRAKQRVTDTNAKFRDAQSKEHLSEVIADNAAKLVVTIKAMETVSTAMATFWIRKHHIFMSQARRMIANESKLPRSVLMIALRQDLIVWEEAKTGFIEYGKEMSSVADAFEFQTNARPIPTKAITVDQLTLNIPTTVDVSGI